ncbi:hypothetical protein LSM04_009587 [Trypanosoma melophagium]|uniref:uncharacterized protein n=1 Tax=Trypanosoma melophagium TaxID=715481 RepID=UPI00351A40E5|nr:hypothetical protein LSM04_009587 [Trypanosoma melophagium]
MFDNDPTVLKKKQSVIDVGQRTQLDLLQGEVRRNKEVLTNMRLENTQLNIALQQAIRGQRRITSDEYFRKEEEQLHNKLCVLKRSLNSVKGKKNELIREIERTIEETNFIIKEGDATIDESSALGQKIRALENRLDKCLIKHNEVNAIRRTYETLLERLQQEQSGFDTRLAAMEKTLQNKERDLSDLNSVATEAARGRDAAKAEVLALKTQITRERREQKKDLEERKTFVATKRAQLEKKSRRLREKMEKDEERRMRARLALSNTQKKKIRVSPQRQLQPEELELQQQRREAYHRLKEATMSNNVGEVVFKLKERQDANSQLLRTTKETEEKNAALLEERQKLQDEWNTLQQQQQQQQGGGVGGTNRLLKSKNNEELYDSTGVSSSSVAHVVEQRALLRRRVLEEFDAHLCDRLNELEETRVEQEWLGQLLVDVNTGVHHLAERLEGINSNINNVMTNTTTTTTTNNNNNNSTPNSNKKKTPTNVNENVSGNNNFTNHNAITITTNRRVNSELASASTALTLQLDSNMMESPVNTAACGNRITELLRASGTALRRILKELHSGDVEATAKCLTHWRGALPASNIHVRLEHHRPHNNNTPHRTNGPLDVDPHNTDHNNIILRDGGVDSRHGGAGYDEDDDGYDDHYPDDDMVGYDDRDHHNNINNNNIDLHHGRNGGHNFSGDDTAAVGRRWLGAAAGSDPADDFPENEIHDRRELKMMSIATVERERKKAKKQQQQQRNKEDSA